jgi:hypothetical protein
MINPYKSVLTYEGDNFEDYLTKIHLIDIFMPVIKAFPEKHIYKAIINFIVWGYSIDSEMLSAAGNSWSKVSPEIFNKTGLSDQFYEDVCLIKSPEIQTSIQKWLQFQNDENFTQFVTYRDLRRQFLHLSLSEMKKNTGEIDIKAKMDAAVYSKDLYKMMEDAKQAFIQNSPKLKASIDALNKAVKTSNTVGPQTFAK